MLNFLLCISNNSYAKTNKKSNSPSKEVVFVVERSMYTNRNSLKNIKNQIINLSDKLLNTNKNISISIIAYNGLSKVLIENSKNITRIKNSLNSLFPIGLSNPTLALEKANKINFSDSKDIILFTNYYPNLGPITPHGSYGPNNHFYFRNANALERMVNSFNTNTRLFTISDFTKLNNKDYGFATKLFNNISNQYFNISNNNELENSMNKIHNFILNKKNNKDTINENKKPIIFIPGVSGSELFVLDEKHVTNLEKSTGMIKSSKEKLAKRIWIPIGYDKDKINKDIKIESNVYGLQQGDLRFANLLDRHAGPLALYGSLFDKLITNFPDRPIYLFSYDWRKSNVETAKKLDAFINTINNNGNTKVDIIAHSMGGLVTSHYLKNHNDKVDKFLSFGTPYEGASKAYNQMTNGSVLGGFTDVVIQHILGVNLSIPRDFTSIVELFPTKKMLDKYPYLKVSNEDKLKNTLNNSKNKTYENIINKLKNEKYIKILDTENVFENMKGLVGKTRFNSFIKNASIYRESNNFSKNIHILNRPNSMFFVGNGYETEVSGYYRADDPGVNVAYEITTKEGDGTVPLFSATMGLTFDEMNNEVRNKFKIVNGNHMTMLLDLENLDKMCSFLNDRNLN